MKYDKIINCFTNDGDIIQDIKEKEEEESN